MGRGQLAKQWDAQVTQSEGTGVHPDGTWKQHPAGSSFPRRAAAGWGLGTTSKRQEQEIRDALWELA